MFIAIAFMGDAVKGTVKGKFSPVKFIMSTFLWEDTSNHSGSVLYLHMLFSLSLSLCLSVSNISVFQKSYHDPELIVGNGTVEALERLVEMVQNVTSHAPNLTHHLTLPAKLILCSRERPILCLLLMMGTLWLGYALFLMKRR